jgi:hypothetical protein
VLASGQSRARTATAEKAAAPRPLRERYLAHHLYRLPQQQEPLMTCEATGASLRYVSAGGLVYAMSSDIERRPRRHVGRDQTAYRGPGTDRAARRSSPV